MRTIPAGLLCGLLLLAPTMAPAVDLEEEPAAARPDPDFVAGKQAIADQDWATAIRAFSSAALRDTRNADIQNYLGFAYRKAGQLETAFQHYERALALNPRHRGAHEYVGEAYLLTGDLAKAEQHLTALERICLLPCDELKDLKEEVERYKASFKR